MKRIISLILINLLPIILFAQTAVSSVTDDSLMNKDGKIYVVVVVLSMILFGVIAYLVYLDTKLRKLEKKHKID